jgi:hypothetical protein
LAHLLFCKLTGTAVHKVCYFRIGTPSGYVIHDRPTNVWKHILIGVGPFILNSLIGLTCGIAAALVHINVDKLTALSGIFMWLAISIAMHSFPSTGDARSMWGSIWSQASPVSAKFLGTPLVAIIFAGALGSIFWLDLIYGFGVVVGLPKLILAA